MSAISTKWTRLASSARLQRSSQTLSVVKDQAWISGGELQPRQPVDNQSDVVELSESMSYHCLRIGTYRISVRFLMALVQWCSGFVSFYHRPFIMIRVCITITLAESGQPRLGVNNPRPSVHCYCSPDIRYSGMSGIAQAPFTNISCARTQHFFKS